ncbi:MAG: rhodanese-like domain-containing protein [Fibrobacterota bacterium]
MSGVLSEGIRRIAMNPGENISIYGGDSVHITLSPQGERYSVELPALGKSITRENDSVFLGFKAPDPGVYDLVYVSENQEDTAMLTVRPFRSEGEAQYEEIDSERLSFLYENRDDALILDVRTEEEFTRGHISEAVHIPLHELEHRYTEISRYSDRPVLLYCRSGNRSTVAANILMEKGFMELYNLQNGIIEWQRSGHEVVR